MARTRPRTAQQRDARELALTRPADPYRGALSDPFTARAVAVEPRPAAAPRPVAAGRQPAGQPTPHGQPPPAGQPRPGSTAALEPLPSPGQPGGVTLAGVLGIVLGLGLGVFGLLLVTIVSLQDQYGAPDRSFYRGTDSSYVILGLIDFGLAALCGIGAIVLFTGRLSGRISMTIGGWMGLILSAYWLEDSSVRWFVPVGVALVAGVMLFALYTRAVTRWLGVLPAPQPE